MLHSGAQGIPEERSAAWTHWAIPVMLLLLHGLENSVMSPKDSCFSWTSVEWVLGEVKLCIYGDGEEYLVLVEHRLKHWHEVTHLHLDDVDLRGLIRAVNSPQNVICIKRDLFGLLGTSFAVIEKKKKKRTKRWRYYSE